MPSILNAFYLSSQAPPTWLYVIDGEGIIYYSNNISLPVIADQQQDITCEAYGAMPTAVLEWRLPDDMAVVHYDQSDYIQEGFYISQKAVTITPSRDNHGKILSCIASHQELSENLQCTVNMNVHVLPMSVLLFSTGGSQSQSRLIYVQEDSPISITCRSTGSFPATELSFQLESGNGLGERILPNISSERSILDDDLFDTEGTVILHLNIVHHGQYIKCFASLEESVVELVYAKVIVYGPPEGIKITSPMDLHNGIEINVTCKAANGYPAPYIHWFIGSRNLTEDSSLNISENKAGRYDAESVLTLRPTRFDHGKSLLCETVQPTTLPARSVNQSLVLNITYHPVVIITARRLTSNISSGTTELVLTCEADANPPVNTFDWLCNETVVSNDTNYRLAETLYEHDEDATLTSSILSRIRHLGS
nr:synaptogenesis protein syg-2-like [Lytechinus pictus]